MNNTLEKQLKKFRDKDASVGIVGLGYVGLPLVDAFLAAGFRVLGFDVDERKVERLNSGESYISHISSESIQAWKQGACFEATSDMARLTDADAILICVPTPLNDSRDPDLSFVVNTTKEIGRNLVQGQLIVLESTTYPGTTRDVMLPILNESGLQAGVDYFLAYSPEREDPGNPDFTSKTIPKVVGGYDDGCLELATCLYAKAVQEVVPVSCLEVAEACKILENTYRCINIALVNELKVLLDKMDVDIWEVINAAKTKPFGFQAFYPGPGLGGHCIPIDPFYLSWVARKHKLSTKFIELAGEVNSSMPDYVVSRIVHALNSHSKPVRGSKIGILGVAYKKDVDDPRESPAFRLMELLKDMGAELTYSDPHISQLPSMRRFEVPELQSEELTLAYVRSQDCLVIATDHSLFDYQFLVSHAQLIVDTRNATREVSGERGNIFRA